MTIFNKVSLLIGFLLVIVGVAALLAPGILVATSAQPAPAYSAEEIAAFVKPVSSDEEMISGPPIRLDIKSADISIEIRDGVYDKQRGTWTLSNDKAHFAVGTNQPNNIAGNTFIYGHNRREVFARITKLVGGEEAEVTTANGHVFVYKLVSRRVVSPTDVSVFAYDGPPILTVQTCTGLFYQNRELFQFAFERVI